MGAPAAEPEPAAMMAPAAAGLEALLGGAVPAADQFQTPSFLSAPSAAPTVADNPLAGLLGGASAAGLGASDESSLISKLLGGALVQLDSDVEPNYQDQQQ